MKTFASLFTGGGGVDQGAIAAGLEPIWGVEYDPAIAEVATSNLPHSVIVADILTVEPQSFTRPNVLHASPPCPNFSIAKNQSEAKGETPLDIALGKQVARFVATLEPDIFTLENVHAYVKSRSWREIESVLIECGYWLHIAFLDAADYGVPQHRRRMIVRAVRDRFLAPLPSRQPHRGWYGAIADLIQDLPETEFTPWQLERLERLGKLPDTFLVGQGERSMPRTPQQPVGTVTANRNQIQIRALLLPGGGQGNPLPLRSPSHTLTASDSKDMRALLVHGTDDYNPDFVDVRDEDEPTVTITASQPRRPLKALLALGRVVRMTPRALARFQTFPDSYKLPRENKTLACRVIGNAVPPLLAQRIYEGLDA